MIAPNRVSSQRVLGIILDEDLSFSPYIDHITTKCIIRSYNRLTLFPDLLRPDLDVQIYKSFICSKLEYGSVIWGHSIHTTKHLRQLESDQNGALKFILRAMKSTPSEALESELNITPIDLRLQELQRIESVKLLQKDDHYILNKMKKQVTGNKISPLFYLGHQSKHVL